MKQYEKDEYQAYLNSEKATIAALKKTYADALNQVDEKIRVLSTRTDIENMPTIIHQKKYQEQLKEQLENILGKLQEKQYKTVNDYLNDCYSESFLRTMYSLNQQGIPFVWPIDQKAVKRAVVLDSKISGGLYTRLGVDVKNFRKSISSEISRGIASSLSYSEIARNLKNASSVPISNASRIVRTEGHRIQNQAKLDTMDEAKKKGADVVKQWDSTLDGNTRPTHRQLDGQIRELDEDFEVDGMHASAPGMFGDPAEDCNCRCAVLQRAKWALDEKELETLQKRAEYYGLDKTDDFNDFKEKYLKAADEESKGADSDSVRSDVQKISNESTGQEKAEDNEQQKLEDESLEWYVSGDGMWVNQYLRGNGDFGELSEQEKSMLDAIDKATKSEIVKENVLYRSVDASVVFGDITDTQYENIYNALKYNDEYAKKQTDRLLDNALNKEFTEKGFMSTTKSEEFALEFGDFTGSEKPMVVKYNVPEGIHGKDLAKFDIEGDEQYEVLLAKDQKYKITSLTAKDGNIFAEADLIPDENILENNGKRIYNKGAISGAYNNSNDPEGKQRDKHAEIYYEELRNSKKDYIVKAVSENSGIDFEQVSKMYDHLLVNEYDIAKGKSRFEPDYYIAESLQRLREGKNIQEHDLILIKHESMEYDLMNNGKMGYEEAHELTNKTYNYQKALDEWLDKMEGR